MATYGNNLRLTEIATGDESGTWGTTTNANWDFATDAFGFGVKNMAGDADQTFTMADGSVDTLRSMYLKITSTVAPLTATRTITIAPNTVSKVWIIENATAGSQSIKIKQGSGAEITIATGTKVMVYTDGAGSGAAVFNANFTAATGGTVTSVAASVPDVFSISGSPITSAGTLTMTYSGTALPAINGGTAQTTYTAGDVLYASGANTLAKLPIGTSGQVIAVSAGLPAWTTIATGNGTVTTVGFTGGIITVANPTTTPAFTIAGTSGGIPYFASGSTWASSAALTQYGVVYGGGAGATPVATAAGTTGQVLTATTGGAPTWAAASGGISAGKSIAFSLIFGL